MLENRKEKNPPPTSVNKQNLKLNLKAILVTLQHDNLAPPQRYIRCKYSFSATSLGFKVVLRKSLKDLSKFVKRVANPHGTREVDGWEIKTKIVPNTGLA